MPTQHLQSVEPGATRPHFQIKQRVSIMSTGVRSSYPREGKEVKLEHGQVQVRRSLFLYRHPILRARNASSTIVETHGLPRTIVQRNTHGNGNKIVKGIGA